jgi:hypothetical protein
MDDDAPIENGKCIFQKLKMSVRASTHHHRFVIESIEGRKMDTVLLFRLTHIFIGYVPMEDFPEP